MARPAGLGCALVRCRGGVGSDGFQVLLVLLVGAVGVPAQLEVHSEAGRHSLNKKDHVSRGDTVSMCIPMLFPSASPPLCARQSIHGEAEVQARFSHRESAGNFGHLSRHMSMVMSSALTYSECQSRNRTLQPFLCRSRAIRCPSLMSWLSESGRWVRMKMSQRMISRLFALSMMGRQEPASLSAK